MFQKAMLFKSVAKLVGELIVPDGHIVAVHIAYTVDIEIGFDPIKFRWRTFGSVSARR